MLNKRSIERLKTCHIDLQNIILKLDEKSDIVFQVTEGHRSADRQNMLYRQGKSKIDGYKRKGKHNYLPSLAVDLVAYVDGKVSWDSQPYIDLYYTALEVEKELRETCGLQHKLRWGGNWDMDGEIITDQNFQDLVHFELA